MQGIFVQLFQSLRRREFTLMLFLTLFWRDILNRHPVDSSCRASISPSNGCRFQVDAKNAPQRVRDLSDGRVRRQGLFQGVEDVIRASRTLFEPFQGAPYRVVVP